MHQSVQRSYLQSRRQWRYECLGDTNAWAIRMLGRYECLGDTNACGSAKILIQLNRKTTEFYRTAVVRANEADLPPAGVQAGLRGLWRTVFARRRQYLMKREDRQDLNFHARISSFSQHCLLSDIVRLSSRPLRGRRKKSRWTEHDNACRRTGRCPT
jgi:hypothetical protein